MTLRLSTSAAAAALLLALVFMVAPTMEAAATVAAGADNGAAARTKAGQLQTTTDALAEVQDAFKAGRTGDAMRRIDVLIASRPADARLRFQKGVMLVDQKRGGEAILVFQRLMRDYPALPEPMNNLAVLYVERGEMEKARLTLEAAIRSKPNYGTAFQNLGDLYTRMASRAYARALQIDDAEGAPKLALIRQLYEPPQFDGDGALLAQVQTQAPTVVLPVLGAAATAASTPTAKAAPTATTPAAAVPLAVPPASAIAAAPNAKPAPVVVAALPAPTAPLAASAAPLAAPKPALASPPPVAVPKPAPAAPAIVAASVPDRTSATAPAAARGGASVAATAASAGADTATPSPRAPRAAPSASAATPSSDVADVNAALRAWAAAWSRRDIAGYVGAYVPGFKGSDASPDAWQAARRARILGKSNIRVDVSAVRVDVDKGVAQASFRQAYAAGELEVNSRKTLEFTRVNGRWLIRRESVGG